MNLYEKVRNNLKEAERLQVKPLAKCPEDVKTVVYNFLYNNYNEEEVSKIEKNLEDIKYEESGENNEYLGFTYVTLNGKEYKLDIDGNVVLYEAVKSTKRKRALKEAEEDKNLYTTGDYIIEITTNVAKGYVELDGEETYTTANARPIDEIKKTYYTNKLPTEDDRWKECVENGWNIMAYPFIPYHIECYDSPDYKNSLGTLDRVERQQWREVEDKYPDDYWRGVAYDITQGVKIFDAKTKEKIAGLKESAGDRYLVTKGKDTIAPHSIYDTKTKKYVSRGEKAPLEKECKQRNTKWKKEKDKLIKKGKLKEDEEVQLGQNGSDIDHFIVRSNVYIPVRKGETDETAMQRIERLGGLPDIEPTDEQKASGEYVGELEYTYQNGAGGLCGVKWRKNPNYVKPDERPLGESEEGVNNADRIVSEFEKSKRDRDTYYKALNLISQLEWENHIDKEKYDECIKKLQNLYSKRDRNN